MNQFFLEKQRKNVEAKFDIFIEWLNNDLIKSSDIYQKQLQDLNDYKFGLLGYYDAEINFQKNMQGIDKG